MGSSGERGDELDLTPRSPPEWVVKIDEDLQRDFISKYGMLDALEFADLLREAIRNELNLGWRERRFTMPAPGKALLMSATTELTSPSRPPEPLSVTMELGMIAGNAVCLICRDK